MQPGGSVELALALEIERGYHIYHPLRLEGGAPTQIRLSSEPAGQVTVGEWRFPAPEIFTAEGDDNELLTLEGPVVVLGKVEVAAEAAPGPLKLAVHVHALACKELCAPVKATAELTLPISADEPKRANAKVFSEARGLLPAPLPKAKYVEGSSVAVSREKLAISEQAEIVATIKVKSGHHINDPQPGVEDLIGSRLFVERMDGLKLGEPVWPAPRIHEAEGVGKVREQAGQVKVRVPVQIIDEKFPSGPVELRVLFHYQCCKDAGACYPPEWAAATVQFVADTPNPPRAATAEDEPEEPEPSEPVVATPGATSPPPGGAAPAQTGGPFDWSRLLLNLVLGFLGGMILNITPCVFPVISIKIVGFVQQAAALREGEDRTQAAANAALPQQAPAPLVGYAAVPQFDRGRVLRLGLVFCAGIMVWFWLFGILTSLGQVPLQHPPVAIALAAILFVLALSLFGVYEIILPGAATGKLGEAASREGYAGAFMNGFLATLLGTACTAPFFAGAAAYAATQPRAIALLIFTAAGLGMSTPYLLLTAFPGWLRRLPKPGPWMVTFKQVMGFVLVATVIWLLMVIGKLLDVRGLVWTIAFLTFLAFGAWLVGRIQFTWSRGQRSAAWLSAVAVSAFGLWFSLFYMYDIRRAGELPEPSHGAAVAGALDPQTLRAVAERVAKADWSEEIPWQAFQPGLAEALSRLGYTVYVDYTAEWCVSCKTNLGTSVEIASTRKRMQELGVVPIIADYTKKNAAMRADLLRFGFNSVPMNLVYPAGHPENVIVLPVILTPGLVHDALQKAGPSKATATAPPDAAQAAVTNP
ncbi:MAG: protein-disulfide reductase DsbD domain-containing protein [Planctomycetota bacterium]